MPYNNTPIAPSKEVSGQVSLPLARVQKIINADPERLHTSKNAAFAIALATELFIQHFATTTHNVVKAETQKKPRRNVQYRDVASAVAKTDNLEFLVDVVPKTRVWKEVREKREKKNAEGEGEKNGEVAEGREGGEKGNVLERLMANGKKTAEAEKEKEKAQVEIAAEAMDVDGGAGKAADAKERPAVEAEDSEPEEDEAAMQIEMEMRGPRTNGSAAAPSPKAPVQSPPALAPSAPASAPAHRPTRSSGFTAINSSN